MRMVLENFLYSLGTTVAPHGNRSLFEHLKGVHDLLRDWDNDEDICNAGLFHSIYGTRIFKHRSLGDRGSLSGLIGTRAENLVHEFSVGERPLFSDVENEETRAHLQEIEAANLVEQGGARKFLKQLLPMNLSNGARAAILLELA